MKRWPVMRHVRWLWLDLCLFWWWDTVGKHYWVGPNPKDIQFLDEVWKGKA